MMRPSLSRPQGIRALGSFFTNEIGIYLIHRWYIPIDWRLMEGYKSRMVEEYQELGDRMIRLQNILTKKRKGELEFELACPVQLLEKQLAAMKMYMDVLEARAKIEGFQLSLVFREEGR